MIDNSFIERAKCKNCKNYENGFCKERQEKVTFEDQCSFFEERVERFLDNILGILMTILHSWLYFADEEIIEIILACSIAERIEGDPLWLFLIAPPGACKTEILRAFTGEYFYHLSNLTSKTFVSGLMIGKGRSRRKIEDLLPQLDNKILIFKDFTTILEKGRDERSEIISQLREIYDGQFSAKFGTIDKAIRYNSRFGLLAGVTPVIDKYWRVMQQLGERFLKIRWNEEMDKTTKKARENEGKEKQMRKELQEAIIIFLDNLKINKTPEFDDEKWGDKISEIAKFVAIARTPISIQDYRTEFYQDFIPIPERPTRLVKQFKKLAKCLAVIRGKNSVDENEIKTTLRIARDTIPQDRLSILDTININNSDLNGCSRPLIYHSVKIPESSIKRVLEQLKLLDLVEERVLREDKGSYREETYYYRLPSFVKNVLYPPTFTVGNSQNNLNTQKLNSNGGKENEGFKN